MMNSMINLSRFTEDGLRKFRDFLDNLETRPDLSPPTSLLQDASEVINKNIILERMNFASRLEAARYLDNIFNRANLSNVESDIFLWSWLTLFFFDQVCPLTNGARKTGEKARYIPESPNFQRYYRHLLAGPYRIYKAHRNNLDKAYVLLCQPLDRPGDVVEQLASRQEIVTNVEILGAATLLYVDKNTRKLKSGVQSSGKPGSPRRFIAVLQQLDVTYDLYALSADELLGLLPKEFDIYKE